jgi:hypothetical protein
MNIAKRFRGGYVPISYAALDKDDSEISSQQFRDSQFRDSQLSQLPLMSVSRELLKEIPRDFSAAMAVPPDDPANRVLDPVKTPLEIPAELPAADLLLQMEQTLVNDTERIESDLMSPFPHIGIATQPIDLVDAMNIDANHNLIDFYKSTGDFASLTADVPIKAAASQAGELLVSSNCHMQKDVNSTHQSSSIFCPASDLVSGTAVNDLFHARQVVISGSAEQMLSQPFLDSNVGESLLPLTTLTSHDALTHALSIR